MSNNIAKFRSENLGEHLNKNIDISEVQRCRKILQDNSLIGILYEGQWAGYEYGNISIRFDRGILISSSQTSGKKDVDIDDFALVVYYDSKSSTAKWYGQRPPSSETPLHWSVYKTIPEINAVIHGHITEEDSLFSKTPAFFKECELPLTQSRSKSNTIGEEFSKLIKESGTKDVIGMNNHDGGFGLIAIDKTLKAACNKLIQFNKRLRAV